MAYKKFTASEDILKPDPRFNSKLVSKFINSLMWAGKKTVAQKIFYGAMDQVVKKMKDVPPFLRCNRRSCRPYSLVSSAG